MKSLDIKRTFVSCVIAGTTAAAVQPVVIPGIDLATAAIGDVTNLANAIEGVTPSIGSAVDALSGNGDSG